MAKFLLLNGPNLNLLGTREPELYGDISLEEIEKDLILNTSQRGHTLETFQSNAEHELVERIHEAKNEDIKCLIFNPGAFTHSSISLRDALAGTKLPFIEIHIIILTLVRFIIMKHIKKLCSLNMSFLLTRH